MTEAELIASGYKRHTSPSGFLKRCDCLYQKWVYDTDERTKLYCFNFYTFHFPAPHGTQFQPEIDFFPADKGFQLRVMFLTAPETTVGDIEAYAADFYKKMGCVPDLHNND